MQRITIDSKILEPLKFKIENSINAVLKQVYGRTKTGEVNIKIDILTEKQVKYNKDHEIVDEWIEPKLKYKVSAKLKEERKEAEGQLGNGFKIIETDNGLEIEEVIR